MSGRKVERRTAGRQEIDGLREIVARDLKDASLPGLSPDRKFATAYNAVLQSASMIIACSGFRVLPMRGRHRTAFEALRIALGNEHDALVDYFDLCRRKRNILDYDAAGAVSASEAGELLKKAEEFRGVAEEWMRRNYPDFAL